MWMSDTEVNVTLAVMLNALATATREQAPELATVEAVCRKLRMEQTRRAEQRAELVKARASFGVATPAR